MRVLGGQGLAGGKLLRLGSRCSDSRIPRTNGEQTDRMRKTGTARDRGRQAETKNREDERRE